MLNDYLNNPFIIPGFLLALIVFLGFYLFRLKKRLDVFLRTGSKDFEGVLKRLVLESESQRKTIKEMSENISKLEKIAKVSIQKVGIVRYSPFKEIGGDQSFSIALLDNKDCGIVITSLFLREGTRIFAKPLINGKSDYSLSEEEKMAIERGKSLKV